jgi:methylenetetrahydrofolate dehydrogenase (NADP+)/methenyltetrahydrofolate cyclohydrolase/formyltetrahydrofolate synthetase
VELPPKVVDDLLAGQVKKVTWATFGDHPSSYFFGYLMKDGNRGHRAGNAIPSTLRPHLDSRGALFRLTSGNLASMAELRVKLGVNRSWVVWTGSVWACRRVPSGLMHTLCQLSSEVQEDGNEASGKLKKGPLTDVTWHGNGSFYFKSGGEHSWNFQSDALKQGWNDLWAGIQHVASTEPTTDLAVSACIFLPMCTERKLTRLVRRHRPAFGYGRNSCLHHEEATGKGAGLCHAFRAR